jgi:hypothetical protein
LYTLPPAPAKNLRPVQPKGFAAGEKARRKQLLINWDFLVHFTTSKDFLADIEQAFNWKDIFSQRFY